MRRRAIIRGLGISLAGLSLPGQGVAASVPTSSGLFESADVSVAGSDASRYEILAAGPAGGRTDRWAKAAGIGLKAVLSPAAPIASHAIGGVDGVTGANRLQALVEPNGKTAAMLPGEAIIAFLTGDTRVHFQPGNWIPVMAGSSAGVMVLRGGLKRLSAPAPIRLAVASPESPDLAAVLAFQKLGAMTAPVFGLRGAKAVARAFVAGGADAVMLRGEDIPADVASLEAEGGVAICSLGVLGDAGQVIRDPQFAGLPIVDDIARQRGAPPLSKPMEQAYRALAEASRIDFMLVLPHLTPAVVVSIWRQAVLAALKTPALRSAAAASAIILSESGAASAMASLDPSSDALLALRQFLFRRFGWRPS